MSAFSIASFPLSTMLFVCESKLNCDENQLKLQCSSSDVYEPFTDMSADFSSPASPPQTGYESRL